ncbi:hypothetical protein K2173_002701 [Erythroxylum novogranatense]|uniref:RNA helicase n=1 Tax=Erythroxylum novogranatense TaxID=1862640 RepID=A0AAV8SWT1_9ROSI|nr:hypothetical protein K2173_002701 [Erythroxylum novogranatense]
MANLPIVQFEEQIIKTVEDNPITVIIGETGSGKSTQLSQILHRRGYTKSESSASLSLAERVAQELGVQLGDEVGYAIRFEDRTSDLTRIKYLTDGVLLRESLSNPGLNQYSVIILDEAHERSLNTDILLGLMKRLIKLRASNLKVLITSATLDGEKVSQFFSECPVLNVPGKLYPVEILYSRERPTSYLESSLKTAIGDVLIFMTGQLVRKLEEKVQSTEEGSQRQYNPSTGMYSLDVVQISKTRLVNAIAIPFSGLPEEFLDVTVHEIRDHHFGSVLYLKSLDLLDIDILNFDFVDPPSYALKQLYLIDAIDADGSISSLGQSMVEPSLSRTLMEANENVALIFERWDQNDYDIGWCKDNDLWSCYIIEFLGEGAGMKFVKDVRKQFERDKESQRDYKTLRKALCVGYASMLAEKMIQHNGYRTIGFKHQLVQVHPSSALKTDDYGMYPNYVVYHELIATPRPYMRNVCAVEMKWVIPVLKKLEKLNINKLSGGRSIREGNDGKHLNVSEKEKPSVTEAPDDRENRIQAARDRFLARKGKK